MANSFLSLPSGSLDLGRFLLRYTLTPHCVDDRVRNVFHSSLSSREIGAFEIFWPTTGGTLGMPFEEESRGVGARCGF